MYRGVKFKKSNSEKRAFLFLLVRQHTKSWCPCLLQGQGHQFYFLNLPFTVSVACKRVCLCGTLWDSWLLWLYFVPVWVCVCLLRIHECVIDRRRNQGGVYHSFFFVTCSPVFISHPSSSCSPLSAVVICAFAVRQMPRCWCCCWSGRRSWGLPHAQLSLCAAVGRSTAGNWAGRIPACSGPATPH